LVARKAQSLDAFVLLREFVGSFQSPLASHHNPARAFVSPAGGSVGASDLRKSSKIIFDLVTQYLHFSFVRRSQIRYHHPHELLSKAAVIFAGVYGAGKQRPLSKRSILIGPRTLLTCGLQS
jgi:hypothetical protein